MYNASLKIGDLNRMKTNGAKVCDGKHRIKAFKHVQRMSYNDVSLTIHHTFWAIVDIGA